MYMYASECVCVCCDFFFQRSWYVYHTVDTCSAYIFITECDCTLSCQQRNRKLFLMSGSLTHKWYSWFFSTTRARSQHEPKRVLVNGDFAMQEAQMAAFQPSSLLQTKHTNSLIYRQYLLLFFLQVARVMQISTLFETHRL
jgi:hypothetical protein